MALMSHRKPDSVLVTSLNDDDCKRFCFESCRLFNAILRNTCMAAQSECDCLRNKLAVPKHYGPSFLSKPPDAESCKKYCKVGACSKYFKFDSPTYSECVGAIVLCNCRSLRVSSVQLNEKHEQGAQNNSTTTWYFIALAVGLVIALVLLCMLVQMWRTNRRRVGVRANVLQRVTPTCQYFWTTDFGQYNTEHHDCSCPNCLIVKNLNENVNGQNEQLRHTFKSNDPIHTSSSFAEKVFNA